jgi:hypothetical protein
MVVETPVSDFGLGIPKVSLVLLGELGGSFFINDIGIRDDSSLV